MANKKRCLHKLSPPADIFQRTQKYTSKPLNFFNRFFPKIFSLPLKILRLSLLFSAGECVGEESGGFLAKWGVGSRYSRLEVWTCHWYITTTYISNTDLIPIQWLICRIVCDVYAGISGILMYLVYSYVSLCMKHYDNVWWRLSGIVLILVYNKYIMCLSVYLVFTFWPFMYTMFLQRRSMLWR